MDKLDEDCKKFLDKFSKEYINASFDHKDPLHTPEQQKDIYYRNNARNRCIISRNKAFNNLGYLEDNKDESKLLKEQDLTEEEQDYRILVDRLEKE